MFPDDISSSSSVATEGHLEAKRHKLAKLYHAAYCPVTGTSYCPQERYCCASKRLFEHTITCTTDCEIPGCKKSRKVWKHYRQCTFSACPLCSVVPTRYSAEALAPRFQQQKRSKTSSSATTSHESSTTSTDVGSMRVLVGRESRRAPRDKENNLRKQQNVIANRQKAGFAMNLVAEEEISEVSSRPPLSPRRPTWALY
jgi:hypothetical protein